MNCNVSNPPHGLAGVMARLAKLMLILAGLAVLAAPLSAGRNPNPGIMPPNSIPHGHSYGEWAAAWWQAVL